MHRHKSHHNIAKLSPQASRILLLLITVASVCQATLYSSTSSSITISPDEANNKLSAVESPVIDHPKVSPKSPANSRQFGDPIYDIQIECNSDSILLTLNTNLGFNGMIYPKGLSKNSTCMMEYHQTSANITYSLPLRSCNTMSTDVEDGVEYFNTVMVQPHRRLVTNQGRGYHIRCRYQTKERTITNHEQQLSVNLSKLTPPVIGSAAMPGCTMKIYSATDTTREVAAENVRIGDELQLVIALDDQDVYGMLVTNCLVRDGMNWGEQPLLDDHGCPVDEEIMPQFVYSQNLTRASVIFQAHKFPYTSSVYYQCNVRLCFRENGCGDVPPNCDRKSAGSGSSYRSSSMETNEIHARSKRWVDGGELDGLASEDILKSANVKREKRSMSLEVFSGLHVDESHELEKDASTDLNKDPMMAASTSDESTMSSSDDPATNSQQNNAKSRQQSEKEFCLSLRKLAIIVSLISLLLMAAIIIMVACMIQKRKHQKLRDAQQYSDNSSYYDHHHNHQSPYINPAYLR